MVLHRRRHPSSGNLRNLEAGWKILRPLIVRQKKRARYLICPLCVHPQAVSSSAESAFLHRTRGGNTKKLNKKRGKSSTFPRLFLLISVWRAPWPCCPSPGEQCPFRSPPPSEDLPRQRPEGPSLRRSDGRVRATAILLPPA